MNEGGFPWGTIAGIGIGLYLLYVAVSGLVVGALARWLLPGPDPMSYPRTIMFGIGGAIIGSIIGWILDAPDGLKFVLDVAGAAGLIWYYRRRKA